MAAVTAGGSISLEERYEPSREPGLRRLAVAAAADRRGGRSPAREEARP